MGEPERNDPLEGATAGAPSNERAATAPAAEQPSVGVQADASAGRETTAEGEPNDTTDAEEGELEFRPELETNCFGHCSFSALTREGYVSHEGMETLNGWLKQQQILRRQMMCIEEREQAKARSRMQLPQEGGWFRRLTSRWWRRGSQLNAGNEIEMEDLEGINDAKGEGTGDRGSAVHPLIGTSGSSSEPRASSPTPVRCCGKCITFHIQLQVADKGLVSQGYPSIASILLGWLWRWLASRCPTWIAYAVIITHFSTKSLIYKTCRPNVLILVASLVSMMGYFLLAYYTPYLTGPAPPFVYFFCALCSLFYQTLMNVNHHRKYVRHDTAIFRSQIVEAHICPFHRWRSCMRKVSWNG